MKVQVGNCVTLTLRADSNYAIHVLYEKFYNLIYGKLWYAISYQSYSQLTIWSAFCCAQLGSAPGHNKQLEQYTKNVKNIGRNG